jgi:TonB family protein
MREKQMIIKCRHVFLLVFSLGIAVCADSKESRSLTENQDARLIPSRAPRRITFQLDGSGDPAHAWDTTSRLPEGVVSPWVLKRVQPTFPDSAIRARLEGKIVVAVWIDKEGDVVKVEALLASADLFLQPTIDAVKMWKFSPLVKDCEPRAIWANLEFSFLLEDGKPIVMMPE